MRLVFSPRARSNLRSIGEAVAETNPAAARKVQQRIRQVLDLLTDFPLLGAVWRETGTRAVVVTGLPYRVHYLVDQERDELRVVAIAHVRQRPPV